MARAKTSMAQNVVAQSTSPANAYRRVVKYGTNTLQTTTGLIDETSRLRLLVFRITIDATIGQTAVTSKKTPTLVAIARP